ncbi:hypothetical protein M0R04_11515 [Candidatus Dojkabacteria bacterium]|jgi:hypothetical protein|nr:hypothetical protein [Candidatus Dojkabacteria bacterium]
MGLNTKTFGTGITLEPQSADPASPSEGQLQYADGTARTEGIWVYKNGAWVQPDAGNAATVTTNANLTGDVTSSGNATTYTTVPILKGGTGQTTKAPAFDALSPMTTGGDIIYGGASGTGTRLANGSAGQVLTSAGGTSAPAWSSPASAPSSFNQVDNLSFVTSVAANALTIDIKDASGNTPSATTTSISFRSSTLTSGAYVNRSITSALSMTVSSGSTLGHTSAVAKNIWLYAIDNAGTVELAVSSNQFDESYLYSTTAEGGAGAADSDAILYSTTARSNVAIRLIGRMLSSQTTAGTWVAVPTDVAMVYQQEVSVSALYTGIPTGTLNSSLNTSTFPTKIKDSHNAYSSGTYAIPVSGAYSISAQTRHAGTFTTGTSGGISIFIDGIEKYTKYESLADSVQVPYPSINVQSIPLLAGQLITIRSYNDGTTPSFATAISNWFSITRTGNY